MTKADIYQFMSKQKLGVLGTLSSGRPQSALVGIAVTPEFEIIFDTVKSSRTGTYHVNADCTGTAHIVVSTGGFVNVAFVVVRKGKEIHAVVTAPFDGPARTVTALGIKVE